MQPFHAKRPHPPPAQRLFEMRNLRRILLRVEAKETKLSFETALGKLESIVESMESGDVPLAELLAKFEEGNKLLKVCETRLKDAELKIEQLKKQKDGKIAFEKFETTRED
jgi:exodeoxyribonuclease VII small subunit